MEILTKPRNKIMKKELNTNYSCPHCKTIDSPRKRYGGVYFDEEIFICDRCKHEFKGYELEAKKCSDVFSEVEKLLAEQYKNREITSDELYLKLREAMNDPYSALHSLNKK